MLYLLNAIFVFGTKKILKKNHGNFALLAVHVFFTAKSAKYAKIVWFLTMLRQRIGFQKP
jgi:hypothetical protein